MPPSVEDVIKDIDAILARARPACVKALEPITKLPPKPGQAYACLELFHMQNYELIYNSFFVRDGALEPDYASHPDFKGQGSFVPELTAYFQKTLGTTGWKQAQEEEFMSRHEKQFLAWFRDCWRSAGGEKSATPTYFCFEKEYQVQDIFTGEVMEEEEAARRLGLMK